jgi:hypothetical protein
MIIPLNYFTWSKRGNEKTILKGVGWNQGREILLRTCELIECLRFALRSSLGVV